MKLLLPLHIAVVAEKLSILVDEGCLPRRCPANTACSSVREPKRFRTWKNHPLIHDFLFSLPSSFSVRCFQLFPQDKFYKAGVGKVLHFWKKLSKISQNLETYSDMHSVPFHSRPTKHIQQLNKIEESCYLKITLFNNAQNLSKRSSFKGSRPHLSQYRGVMLSVRVCPLALSPLSCGLCGNRVHAL